MNLPKIGIFENIIITLQEDILDYLKNINGEDDIEEFTHNIADYYMYNNIPFPNKDNFVVEQLQVYRKNVYVDIYQFLRKYFSDNFEYISNIIIKSVGLDKYTELIKTISEEYSITDDIEIINILLFTYFLSKIEYIENETHKSIFNTIGTEYFNYIYDIMIDKYKTDTLHLMFVE